MADYCPLGHEQRSPNSPSFPARLAITVPRPAPQHIFIREELEKVSEALGQMNRAHFLSIVLNLGASMIQH